MQTSKKIVSLITLLHPVKLANILRIAVPLQCSVPLCCPALLNFEEEMKTHTTGYILTALLDLRAELYEQ